MSGPEDMLNAQYAENSYLRDQLHKKMDEVDGLKERIETLTEERDRARELAVAFEQAGDKFQREAQALALEIEGIGRSLQTPFGDPAK